MIGLSFYRNRLSLRKSFVVSWFHLPVITEYHIFILCKVDCRSAKGAYKRIVFSNMHRLHRCFFEIILRSALCKRLSEEISDIDIFRCIENHLGHIRKLRCIDITGFQVFFHIVSGHIIVLGCIIGIQL